MSDIFYVDDSRIHGSGVFTCVDLPSGMTVPVPSEITLVEDDHNVYLDDDMTCVLPEYPFCYLNHSDQPNCAVVQHDDSEELYLETLREVFGHEEITFDYQWDEEE